MNDLLSERASFDERVESALVRLAPAELRLAHFFIEQKETVLLGSAAQIAAAVGISDATVIRTVRALGYESLSSLRKDILTDLTGTASPGNLMMRTLEETGSDPSKVLDHVIGVQDLALSVMKRPDFAVRFSRCVDLLAGGDCRHIFGIGPSGTLAAYASLQFNRIGLASRSITQTGVGLADSLLWLKTGDVILMMAYAPIYREVSIVLDRAQEYEIPVVLISDSLGPLVTEQIAETLPLPRGKADHLALHSGTMVLLEALTLGLAARDYDRSINALDDLSTLRGTMDKSWQKRGTRKSKI